jgi:hypothetical protein
MEPVNVFLATLEQIVVKLLVMQHVTARVMEPAAMWDVSVRLNIMAVIAKFSARRLVRALAMVHVVLQACVSA